MVMASGGWTITTAAAIHGTLSHRSPDFRKLCFSKLPLPAFSRNVSLYARKDILNDVPQVAATRLRNVLSGIFEPATNEMALPLYPDITGNDLAG